MMIAASSREGFSACVGANPEPMSVFVLIAAECRAVDLGP
jgi:hypothetical protein